MNNKTSYDIIFIRVTGGFMQYKTLYRKYRPSNFDETVGQDIPIKILKNSVIEKKIAHAYLFHGVRGTGKTSLAKVFSRSINCLNNKDGNPCEECENCLLTKDGNYIDIIEIDAASNNGVDEIRELKDNVKFLPTKLKYKVYIIDEVHMLSDQAFNALLKTLEEPPEHVVFILATTEYAKLPKTIVSRCQTLEFKKIDSLSMTSKLLEIANKEKISIDKAAIEEICFYSDGGLRDAIGYLEKVNSFETGNITINTVREMFNSVSNNDVIKILDLIDSNKPEELLELIDKYFDEGIEPFTLANAILSYIREEIIVNKKYNKDYFQKVLVFDDIIKKIRSSEHPNIIFEISLLNMLTYEYKIEKKYINKNTENKKELKEHFIEDFSDSLKKIRVGNTLCDPAKEIIVNIRKNWSNIKKISNSDENLIRMLYYDVKPVAASKTNLILISKELGISVKINNSIKEIEQMYNSVFDYNHKIVCISEKEWDIYKNKYEHDRDSFVYIEEDSSIKNKEVNDRLSNKVNKLFGKKDKGE